MRFDRPLPRAWACLLAGISLPLLAAEPQPTNLQPPQIPQSAPQSGVRECANAQAAVPHYVGSLFASVSAVDRSAAQASVAAAVKAGKGEADGYDAVAGGAFLGDRMYVASWAALEAASRGWNARRATNVGVALAYIGRAADARPFIECARALDPQSVFALEAQAMLTYWRKDCAAALPLFDQLVAAAPRDMNVHYSSGAAHYRCGDRGRGVAELRAANEIAPSDPVVAAALKAASAGAPSAPSPMPPAVRRQVDELLRFMADAIAIADRARTEQLALNRIFFPNSPGGQTVIDVSVNLLHRRVEDQRRTLAMLEQQTAKMPAFGTPMQRWGGILNLSIHAYFEITSLLYTAVTADAKSREVTVMASALGLTPAGLAERMVGKVDGDYVIQDAMQIYVDATRPVNGVARPCGVYVPAYQQMVESVQANLNALVDGIPRAAAREATAWLRYARQAADYGQRTSRLIEFPNAVAGQALLANFRQSYDSAVRHAVLEPTAHALSHYKEEVPRMEAEDPRTVKDQRPVQCYGTPPKPATLADTLEALFNALQAAGEYDAKFESPDCNITIGSVSVSCKPLAFEGVKASWDGPVKVSASATDTRWGVDLSQGPLSGGSGGSRMDVAESKIRDGAYGVEASVGMSTWMERSADGEVNVFAEAKTSLGVGVEAEGLGSVSCDVFEATAKVNLRAFAAALVQ
jgi:tetratricopeptide (TPR) repeat protein